MLRALAAQIFLHTLNFGCRSVAKKQVIQVAGNEVDHANSKVRDLAAVVFLNVNSHQAIIALFGSHFAENIRQRLGKQPPLLEMPCK